MRTMTGIAAVALVAGLMTPARAWAWGAPGCVNLPEYERALGALQGMTSACDMSVAEANRIVAAHGNRPGGLFGAFLGGGLAPSAPPPRVPRGPDGRGG